VECPIRDHCNPHLRSEAFCLPQNLRFPLLTLYDDNFKDHRLAIGNERPLISGQYPKASCVSFGGRSISQRGEGLQVTGDCSCSQRRLMMTAPPQFLQ
jgi:hypothetical protein